MKKLSKESTIGIITVISLTILYFGINYLKGINLFNPTNYYYVTYDNVSELKPSNTVYVEGYKVGLVHNIIYNYESNSSKIVVVLDLDKKLQIPTGSKAELAVSLMGTASINLHFNKYVSTYCHHGDTLEGYSPAGMMTKVQNDILPQLEKMLPRIDTILTALQAVITSPALSESLQHISSTTRNLDQSTAQLNSMLRRDVPVMMGNFKTVSSNLAGVSEQFNKMNFVSTLDSVNVTISNLNAVTRSLNNPNGTVGLLLNDRQLYDNLNSTASNANLLVKDLKEHPKRYVHFSIFGKKEKEEKK